MNADPIAAIFSALGDGWLSFLSQFSGKDKPLIAMEVVVIVIMMPWIWLDRRRRKSDVYWSDVCGTLMRRIRKLVPAYEQAVKEYTDRMVERIKNDKELLELARKIDADTMLKAERDLCSFDMENPEAIGALIAQLKVLKGGSSNELAGA